MEDLNDIYFFSSVVQYGGFSAAARAIGVEKTRLSRRISGLEKRLGVRLLQRTTRGLALTEALNYAGSLWDSFASVARCC
jgi:DNA-binding transcriptional LysR family regulator